MRGFKVPAETAIRVTALDHKLAGKRGASYRLRLGCRTPPEFRYQLAEQVHGAVVVGTKPIARSPLPPTVLRPKSRQRPRTAGIFFASKQFSRVGESGTPGETNFTGTLSNDKTPDWRRATTALLQNRGTRVDFRKTSAGDRASSILVAQIPIPIRSKATAQTRRKKSGLTRQTLQGPSKARRRL